jgi:ABC-2 type transport system ATP-binding protein
MIEIKELTKYFGDKKVVDDVSFSVEKGEILGFLGPNGAGKSTTMRMATGFIPPSSGTAVIGGFDIRTDSLQARRKIGYLPENAPVYPDMSVVDFLGFCAEIRGFSGADKTQKIDRTIEKCFLSEVRHQSVSTLSKGFKQRVCFAQSILHDPEYLIMDEPTDGLDPNQKHEVRLMIREMSATKAIILSTHILDEVDAVCTRAIIIAKGQIIADESPATLKKKSMMHNALTLTLAQTDHQPLISAIKGVNGVDSVKVLSDQADERTVVQVLPTSANDPITDPVLTALKKQEYAIENYFVDQGRLDDVFRAITRS